MSVDRSQIVNILHEAVTNPNMPFMGDNREELINELRDLQRVIACGSILIEQALYQIELSTRTNENPPLRT